MRGVRAPRRFVRMVALLAVCAPIAPALVRAQSSADCAAREPGPCWVFPRPSTPEPVTLDAPIKVRYTPGFFDTYGSQATAIDVFVAATGAPVAGAVRIAAPDVLYFVPDGGWMPGTAYQGSVYGQGPPIDFGFTTGSEVDRRAPTMDPIGSITPRPGFEIPELGPGSERVDVEFDEAIDDGPLGSIEYQIYVTRGHGVDAPRLRLIKLGQPSPIPAAIGLTSAEASEPVCIAVVAVDGVGKTGQSPEACFDPEVGTRFQPLCSAVPSPTGAGLAGLILPVGAALFACRRRRRGAVFTHRRPRID